MKKIFPFLAIFLFILACEKEKSPSRPNQNEPDPVDHNFKLAATADVVMYEVNLRAFSESGDIKGVQARLNHLQKMGVNVIWLMPIYPQGEVKSINSPYSIKNFTAVSNEYGNLNDLKQFVQEAHERGMAVILDWVANHTAWDHPWINDHKAWYTQNTAGEIVHPPGTNWQDVADLNFDKPEMRAAMIAAMKYWIAEADIDGYRCDYADGVPFDFWQQAIDSLRLGFEKNILMLAEGGRNDHFQAGFDLNFGWTFYGQIKNVFDGDPANTLLNVHSQEYAQVPAGKRKLRFTTNHDESAWDATPIMLFNGKEGATAATVAMTFMGSAPLIYTGQETGRSSTVPFFSNSPIDWTQNPGMQQAYRKIYSAYSQGGELTRALPNKFFTHPDVLCYGKESASGDSLMVVVVNCRNQNVSYTVPAALQNRQFQNMIDSTTFQFNSSLNLAPYEYRLAFSLE